MSDVMMSVRDWLQPLLWAGLVMVCAIAGESPAVAQGPLHAQAEKFENEIEPHNEVVHGAEEAHGKSSPITWDSDLALWSLISFSVLLLILWGTAWRPLTTGLDRREARIRQDIADADAARVKAERMLAEHEQRLARTQDEVREILAEARRDAEHTKQEILETAQRETEAMRQRAVLEIERSRDHALSELFDYVARNVADATEHVLGRSLTDQDQDRLVQEALAQLESNGSRR
jgi:F-type H+-transporting ATPase subunit b